MKTETKQTAVTSGTQAAAPSAKPKPELSQCQALVADEVARLLTTGGRKEDLNDLLAIVLTAATRRMTDEWSHLSKNERHAELAKYVARDLPTYRDSIMASWRPTVPASSKEAAETNPAKWRINESIMKNLADQFQGFLLRGNPCDHFFLYTVLDYWQNVSRSRVHVDNGIPIANAFARMLESEQKYVHVPESLVDLVTEYIERLTAAQAA